MLHHACLVAGPGVWLDSCQQPAGDVGEDEEILPAPHGSPSHHQPRQRVSVIQSSRVMDANMSAKV